MRRIGALVLGVAFATGCTTVAEYKAPALPAPTAAPELYKPPLLQDYRLQVGDALAIRSYFDSQLNQDVAVRADGRISAVLVGDTTAIGTTPTELAAKLREHYRGVIGDTDITVIVTRSAGMNVFLSGEIRNPSLLPLEGDLTLLQAVARAGGLLSSAHTTGVLLIRGGADGSLTVSMVDIEKVLRNEIPDVYLRARDVIHVPKTSIAQAGLFVEQYINAIVPRAVQLQFGWFSTRVTNRNPAVQIGVQ